MKKLLLSVTGNDCDWSYYVGPGNGGQKKQKTKSGVICVHRASKASSRCHEDRMQALNKKRAFLKMIETTEFKAWHKMEIARISANESNQPSVEEVVETQMKQIKVEIKDQNGRWVEDNG